MHGGLFAAVEVIVLARIAAARMAYINVLWNWHEAEPAHCGGDCFSAEMINAAMNGRTLLEHQGDPPTQLTLVDAAALEVVWKFAVEYARTSGDGPDCNCTPCQAARVVGVAVKPSKDPSLSGDA